MGFFFLYKCILQRACSVYAMKCNAYALFYYNYSVLFCLTPSQFAAYSFSISFTINKHDVSMNNDSLSIFMTISFCHICLIDINVVLL